MKKCSYEDKKAEPLSKKESTKERQAIRKSIDKEGKDGMKKKEEKRMVDHKALRESPAKKEAKERLKSKMKVIKTKDGY